MKPILFNTEMVKAILNGNKTQTRRPVKKDLIVNLETDKNDPDYLYVQDQYGDSHHLLECAPYYKDQTLYVRETFADIAETAPGNIHYKASATEEDLEWFNENGWNWRPSIHMPKELARIFLKVTDVRVERLQKIVAQDIHAEGVIIDKCQSCLEKMGECRPQSDVDHFCGYHEELFEEWIELWNNIYAEKGYGWDKNLWVWIIEFEKIEKPE